MRERPPDRGVLYSVFSDPSGGSSDSMTLAIGHKDFSRQMVVLDALREVRPPFSPERVCEEFAKVLKSYKVFSVVGDRYAYAWPIEQFSRFGIRYEQAAKPKSDLYVDLLPLVNSARIQLLDEPRSIAGSSSCILITVKVESTGYAMNKFFKNNPMHSTPRRPTWIRSASTQSS